MAGDTDYALSQSIVAQVLAYSLMLALVRKQVITADEFRSGLDEALAEAELSHSPHRTKAFDAAHRQVLALLPVHPKPGSLV